MHVSSRASARAALLLAFVLLSPAAAPLRAQAAALAVARPTASDSAVFRRAQQLITEGKTPTARALVDSVLSAARDGSPMMVDALYWRAVFADSPEQARRDYVRITVQYSSAPRVEWALLRLAQLELSRGARAPARRYLDRLILEYPDGRSRPLAQFLLGRTLLDEGAVVRGCSALGEARQRAVAGDVEFLNQVGYAQRACGTEAIAADSARLDSLHADSLKVDAAKAAAARRADSIAVAKKAIRTTLTPSPLKDPVTPPAPSPTTVAAAPAPQPSAPAVPAAQAPAPVVTATTPSAGAWTVQLAAYQVLADADRLSAKMKTRGYDVRVTPDRPYRVRIGHFATRAEAVALVAKLSALQITAIVMETEKP